MGVKLEVQIKSGTDIGASSPFVVVGLDRHLTPELYKTSAVAGGTRCTWDESFELDLTTAMKTVLADGHAEPTYLTFNVFDAATDGFPSVGSAGVLLDNVQELGEVHGDFPMVNGTGTLELSVGPVTKKGWVHTKQAKRAGVVGAVAVSAVAAGLTARHFHNKKKERQQKEDSSHAQGQAPPAPPAPPALPQQRYQTGGSGGPAGYPS